MSEARIVERFEDMSPTGRLALILQPDGDVIVVTRADPRELNQNSVEFCAPFGGGGRSRHTLDALRRLAEAMEKDNVETPLQWRGEKLTQKDWARFHEINDLNSRIRELQEENALLKAAIESRENR